MASGDTPLSMNRAFQIRQEKTGQAQYYPLETEVRVNFIRCSSFLLQLFCSAVPQLEAADFLIPNHLWRVRRPMKTECFHLTTWLDRGSIGQLTVNLGTGSICFLWQQQQQHIEPQCPSLSSYPSSYGGCTVQISSYENGMFPLYKARFGQLVVCTVLFKFSEAVALLLLFSMSHLFPQTQHYSTDQNVWGFLALWQVCSFKSTKTSPLVPKTITCLANSNCLEFRLLLVVSLGSTSPSISMLMKFLLFLPPTRPLQVQLHYHYERQGSPLKGRNQKK